MPWKELFYVSSIFKMPRYHDNEDGSPVVSVGELNTKYKAIISWETSKIEVSQ